MPEARMLQLPVRPAIGGGGRLPRTVLLRRGGIALVLILLLGLAKYVVASREVAPDSLSALPAGRSVTVGLDIGGTPTDSELQALADSYGVDGVVNLGAPSVAEQATAGSLQQGYLVLPLAEGTAPTWVQLHTLAAFMRSHTKTGGSVYMHNNVGGGRAVVNADMLLLLRGEGWAAVSHGMTSGERRSLSTGQLRAINQLISALRPSHELSPPNPYADAGLDPW